MRQSILWAALLLIGLPISQSFAQYPGTVHPGSAGSATGSATRGSPLEEIARTPRDVVPEKAAQKAYAAGTKTMTKAHELEEEVAKNPDPEKRARAQSKLEDTYAKALDQFTEVLRNKNDMYEAWSQVGYIHLKFGAFRESIDDYDHALALKPDYYEGMERRAEAYLGADRLDEAKGAYMDLFYHDRANADQLMVAMQAWVSSRRTSANGVRPSDIDAFDKWLQDRDSAAKATASSN